MKKITIISICILAIVIVVAGCKKNIINYGDIQKLDGSEALLKINYASQYANNRSIFLKINDVRVSNLITGRTPFPGGGYNTGGASTNDFLTIFNPGTVKISVVLPHKPDVGTDSLELYSTTIQLAAGKKYVAHITDTATTTKTLLTEENFTKPDSSFSRYRFTNLMPNVPAIDLYYGATSSTAADQSSDSLLVSNVGYLTISPEFLLKVMPARNWKIRPAGAAKTKATVLATYTSASVILSQRVYTIFASGYSGKTNTQKPYVSFFLVR